MKEIKLRIFPTKPDKSPLGKWKDSETYISFKDWLQYNLPETWSNIGLAVPKGFTVYDFDAPKEVTKKSAYKKKVIQCFSGGNNIIMESDKGIHVWVYSEEPQTAKLITKLGLIYDIRGGGLGYVIIKRNDKIRKILKGDAIFTSWKKLRLKPIKWSELKPKEQNFFRRLWRGDDLEGERNNLMFNVYKNFLIMKAHNLKPNLWINLGLSLNALWNIGLPEQEIRSMMAIRPKEKKFIEEITETNKSVFIMTKKRDKEGNIFSAIKKSPNGLVSLQFENALEQFWKDHSGIGDEKHKKRVIRAQGSLYIVDDQGKWHGSEKYQISYLGAYYQRQGGLVSEGDLKKLLEFLFRSAEERYQYKDFVYLINEGKCINNLGQVIDFDSDKHQSLLHIQIDLKSEISKESVKKFIKFFKSVLVNKEDVEVLLKHWKYVLLPTKTAKKALVLTGQSNSGKSTLGKLLGKCIGVNNYSVINLKTLLEERFGTQQLCGKAMFYDDDIGNSFQRANTGLFKSIISNLEIRVEEKFENAYTDILAGKLWVFTNSTFMIKEGEGLDNRLDIVETKKIKYKDIDPNILEKFSQEDCQHFLNYLLLIRTDIGIREIAVETLNKPKFKFLWANNNIFNFLCSIDVNCHDYGEYKGWAKAVGVKPFSRMHFLEERERWFRNYEELFLQLFPTRREEEEKRIEKLMDAD